MRYYLSLAFLGLLVYPGLAADPARKPDRVAGLTARLSSPDPDIRRQAAVTLGNLGLAGRAAVPALAKALHDREGEVRKSAGKALGQIGKPALPVLLQALEDRDEDVRARAARALGQMGPDAREAVPALLRCLKDPYRAVRLAAIGALGEMGPEAKPAVASLVHLLRDPNEQIRERAALALVQIGADAVPPLCEAMRNDKEAFRLDVIKAVGLLGAEAKAAVPALREAMKDDDFRIRAAAAEALGRMEADAEDAVPELLDALHDKNREVHDKAANALVSLTTAGVPGLLEKIRQVERKDRWLIPALAAQQQARANDPLTRWLDDLRNKDPKVRARAALVLGGMGQQAQRAVPALKRYLTDDNAQVRLSVAMALAHIQRSQAEMDLLVRRTQRAIKRMKEAMIEEARSRFLVQGIFVPPSLTASAAQLPLYDVVFTYIAIKATQPKDVYFEGVIQALGAEAVPALVEGLNFVAANEIGSC